MVWQVRPVFVTFGVYIRSIPCHIWLSCHSEPHSVAWSRSEVEVTAKRNLSCGSYFNFTLTFQITVDAGPCLVSRRTVHPPQPEVNPVIQMRRVQSPHRRCPKLADDAAPCWTRGFSPWTNTREKQLVMGQVRKTYHLHNTGARLCKLASSRSPVRPSDKAALKCVLTSAL